MRGEQAGSQRGEGVRIYCVIDDLGQSVAERLSEREAAAFALQYNQIAGAIQLARRVRCDREVSRFTTDHPGMRPADPVTGR